MMILSAFLLKLRSVEGFGDKLRAMREARGWSQPQLAERMGVSGQTVCSLELGNSNPSLKTFLAVRRVFGVSVEYLLSEPEEDSDRADIMAAFQAFAGRMDVRALAVARDIMKALARIGDR